MSKASKYLIATIFYTSFLQFILPYSVNRSKLLVCKHCRTLEAAQIKKDRYFHSIIHEDIDRIVDDLRILHQENKKDTLVASDDTGGLQILIDLVQKLKDFKGSPQEMKLKLFTLILGTDINKLNGQESATILKLIKKGEMTWKRLNISHCP